MPEILVVTGMRRTGKTTLCRMLFDRIESKNKVFVDMENPVNQKLFEELDYVNILHNLKKTHGISLEERLYVFLDEIQSVPESVKAVKYLYDHFGVKFILTGSSSFYLKNLMPESLAGRKFIYELYPLDFEEFLWFKGKKLDREKNVFIYEQLKSDYDEYLEYGGFPGVVSENDPENKKIRLDDIFKSYFEKDVQIVGDFRDIGIFRDLLLLIMQRTASKIDLGKLGSEVGIDRRTADKYLKFLESTYFIRLVMPYSTNRDNEIRGQKKVYLCDTGFLNRFAKVDSGCVFENAVFNTLDRRFNKVNYYQTKTGQEIDFVVPDEKMAFEVKYSGAGYDYQKLNRLPTKLDLKNFYVVTHNFDKRAGFIPALDL